MIRFERKNINNKTYYYLSEQIKTGNKYKKIQVFVGKTIPKETEVFYNALREKERALVLERIKKGEVVTRHLETFWLEKIENNRIDYKYFVVQRSAAQRKHLLRKFAISFIFESNAMEGSKLAQSEVEAIIKNKYVKKSLLAKYIVEVENSIDCFRFLESRTFKLNQKSIKKLHEILVRELEIPFGFKTRNIIVNNKETTEPKKVRLELTKLFAWYIRERNTLHPFERAIIFHNRFEHIHPFMDGNGRVGRLILNWMLMKSGYGFLLFTNSKKVAYMSALDKGDVLSYRNILKLSTDSYQKTIREFCLNAI